LALYNRLNILREMGVVKTTEKELKDYVCDLDFDA